MFVVDGTVTVTFEKDSYILVKTTDMCIDMDQLRNMACAHPEYSIKQTLADSIYYGGGIRFKGKIEPYSIVALN